MTRYDLTPNVIVTRNMAAGPEDVFAWLADSRNYSRASMVFRCPWVTRDPHGGFGVGAVRDVIMAAGWYREQITQFEPGHLIGYRVQRSLPPVRQEHSLITVTDQPDGTHVTWEVAVHVRLPLIGPLLTRASAPIAQRLYGTIIDACARDLTTATKD